MNVHPATSSAVPALPFLVEINWGDILNVYVVPIGILLLILFVPHVIAAQVFTPKSNFLLVVAACVMQLIFIVLVLMALILIAMAGRWYLAIGGLIVFVTSALVMTGIYRFEFVKGLGYNAIVLVLAAGLAWAMIKFYPDLLFRRIVTPVCMQSLRWSARPYQTEEEAQRAAVKQFPELGIAGSDFNRRFLEKRAKYKAEQPEELKSPGWPVVLAGEVGFERQFAKLLGNPADAPAATAPQ